MGSYQGGFIREDNIRDISALGGLPFYIAVMLWFFAANNKAILYELMLSLLLCYAITTSIRLVYFKKRPDADRRPDTQTKTKDDQMSSSSLASYNQVVMHNQKYKNIFEKIDASSFPSLHAMRAGALGVIVAAFFNNIVITAAALVMIGAVGATRVMLRRHHSIDTTAGIAIGGIIAVAAIYAAGHFFVP